ncbi:MAG: methylmalonyl Co-A mutase-associated GTPase MeaB [Acidimicrobiales bacterium]
MKLPDLKELVEGVAAGDRTALGRAITLVESSNPAHFDHGQDLLARLLELRVASHRVGITGVPGVGKSTFIDSLGTNLTAAGHRVAVLAVDPTSTRTGGSILADKTRMPRLATDSAAFIRPSPTSGALGGVARSSRESVVVVEAAGFDVVLVETVGVGQSETMVAAMVDFFCVLMLAGAGDELQGIKKGVLELADLVAVNKADGDNVERAAIAVNDYQAAMHLTRSTSAWWTPPVLACSGLHNQGLDTLWQQIELHRRLSVESGEFEVRRQSQQLRWMWSLVDDQLLRSLRMNKRVTELVPNLELRVKAGQITPTAAALEILEANR